MMRHLKNEKRREQEMILWLKWDNRWVIIIWWLKKAEVDVNGQEDDVNGEKYWQ
jgi:hypothetical protein